MGDFITMMIVFGCGIVFEKAQRRSLDRERRLAAMRRTAQLIRLGNERGEDRGSIYATDEESMYGDILMYLETDGYQILERERRRGGKHEGR